MDPNKIFNMAKSFMPITKEIAVNACDFLKTKSENDYNKLDTSLKATGFTVKTFFDALQDNTNNKDFFNSFRDTSALVAEIEIIKNSTEFSDAEKIERLHTVHKKQMEQQAEADKFLNKQHKNYFLETCAFICLTVSSITVLKTGSLPTIKSSKIKGIPSRANIKLPKLPKK